MQHIDPFIRPRVFLRRHRQRKAQRIAFHRIQQQLRDQAHGHGGPQEALLRPALHEACQAVEHAPAVGLEGRRQARRTRDPDRHSALSTAHSRWRHSAW